MLPPLKFLGEAEENVSRETSHIALSIGLAGTST